MPHDGPPAFLLPVESSEQSVALLTLRELSVSFPGVDKPVVDRVSFSLNRGETLALVGESGAGKSMTGLAIQSLVPFPGLISAGQIVWKGTDLVAQPESALRRIRGREIGTVWQEPSSVMNPAIKVGRQIAEVIRVHTGASRREAGYQAVDLLDRVRIPEAKSRFHAYPGELSGGMLQRVVIAAAIACRPDLLIADEATTALDASVQRQVLELISELQREIGMAILFITHNLALVAEMADRVAVMRHGRIVELNTVDNLFAHPQATYTGELLQAIPRPFVQAP